MLVPQLSPSLCESVTKRPCYGTAPPLWPLHLPASPKAQLTHTHTHHWEDVCGLEGPKPHVRMLKLFLEECSSRKAVPETLALCSSLMSYCIPGIVGPWKKLQGAKLLMLPCDGDHEELPTPRPHQEEGVWGSEAGVAKLPPTNHLPVVPKREGVREAPNLMFPFLHPKDVDEH